MVVIEVQSSLFLNKGCAFGFLSSHVEILLIFRLIGLLCLMALVKNASCPLLRGFALIASGGVVKNLFDSFLSGGVIDTWEVSFYSFALALNISDLVLSSFCIFFLMWTFFNQKKGKKNDFF